MGGRGTASRSGRANAAGGAGGGGGTGGASKKAAKALSGGGGGGGGRNQSAAEKLVGTSVKSVTKGMTQSMVKNMSRSQLETISLLQTAKSYMKNFKLSADEAVSRAKLMVPQQTTAQLRKGVWKYRNMD